MKHLFTAAVSLAAIMTAGSAMAQTEIQWWHAMTGANNDVVNKLAADFNASPTAASTLLIGEMAYGRSRQAA